MAQPKLSVRKGGAGGGCLARAPRTLRASSLVSNLESRGAEKLESQILSSFRFFHQKKLKRKSSRARKQVKNGTFRFVLSAASSSCSLGEIWFVSRGALGSRKEAELSTQQSIRELKWKKPEARKKRRNKTTKRSMMVNERESERIK